MSGKEPPPKDIQRLPRTEGIREFSVLSTPLTCEPYNAATAAGSFGKLLASIITNDISSCLTMFPPPSPGPPPYELCLPFIGFGMFCPLSLVFLIVFGGPPPPLPLLLETDVQQPIK